MARGALTPFAKQEVVEKHDIVLIGDRHPDTLRVVLEQGIDCIIVTGNGQVPHEIIEEAQGKNIFVLSSPYDTYTCGRLINQCVPVRRIMHENPVCFKPLDLLSDIKGAMDETNYRNYPVIENGQLVGLISKDNLMMPERERVILVDHNERGQAVESENFGDNRPSPLGRHPNKRADFHPSRAGGLHGHHRGEYALAQGY